MPERQYKGVLLCIGFLFVSVPPFARGADVASFRVERPNKVENRRVWFRSAGELAFQVTPEQPKPDLPPATASQARPPVEGAVYRVGGGVSNPVAISKRDPEYSEEARKAHLWGTVVLTLVVGPDGLAHDIRVVRPLGMGLDEKAVATFGQWRFRPGLKKGNPVAVQATIEVNFRMLDNNSRPLDPNAWRIGRLVFVGGRIGSPRARKVAPARRADA